MEVPMIEVRHLKKYFDTPKGLLHAVDDVSFKIGKGKTMGVVGESGCGKSTLGRTIIHLLESTDGQIFLNGEDITHVNRKKMHEINEKMQIVFQDPYSSLNPRQTVEEIIKEPLKLSGRYKTRAELNAKTEELMGLVGIDERLRLAYPHELDGGRRQRVGIARALALSPDFIVCDEPVSALDVSIQAQVLNLLQDLQQQRGLTYMFVTHDLSVVRHISDDICVMYLGQLVETAPAKELFAAPLHPYTKALLSAIPSTDIHSKQERIRLKGEITSPIDPKPGCRFAARCPYACENCRKLQELQELMPNHFVSCCRAKEINGL
ncbi:MAG: ATP-binding cassette domain-containing protein [Clostridia bacterium]|nr:ATP-binding cassette domain-containing protein [Clostridia bacterium]